MIILQLTNDQGGAREYRVERACFSLGPRSGCDVVVPRSGGAASTPVWELRFQQRADTNVFEVMANTKGIVCDGIELSRIPTPVSSGSTIVFPGGSLFIDHEHQIDRTQRQEQDPVPQGDALTVAVDLSGSSAPPSLPKAEQPKGKEVASPRPLQDNTAKANKNGDDYLSVFLKPVSVFLDDDDVSEIMINGPRQVFIERKGRLELTDAIFANEESLQAALKNVARSVGRRLDSDMPRLDARLLDGSRVHAVIPPLARNGTVVAIRKFSRDRLTIDKLIAFGALDRKTAGLIEAIVRLKKNIIVSGPTSSGKTSVLNVLSRFIPNDERIIVIEDATELQLQQIHLVQFEARKPDEHGKGEVSIRDLVHSSLRLRPDRLVVGEIRGGEALDLLQAFNTGHSGSMTTIHANGPKDALWRLETCALLSGIDIPLAALREQVASAVNVVIHTARLPDGSRKITHVSEVLPLDKGEYAIQDIASFVVDHVSHDGKLEGDHRVGLVRATFIDEAIMHGLGALVESFKNIGE